MSYRVFTRTWWKENPEWPDGLEPYPGRKTILHKRVVSEEQARAICKEWCSMHPPGRLSRKAEYEEN